MRFESKQRFSTLGKMFQKRSIHYGGKDQEAMCYYLNFASECNPLVKNKMVGNSECFSFPIQERDSIDALLRAKQLIRN